MRRTDPSWSRLRSEKCTSNTFGLWRRGHHAATNPKIMGTRMLAVSETNVSKSGPTIASFGTCQSSNQASECAWMNGRIDATASSGFRTTTTYFTSGP